ncbi:hypothetical protein [Caldiplasma sukawensis]
MTDVYFIVNRRGLTIMIFGAILFTAQFLLQPFAGSDIFTRILIDVILGFSIGILISMVTSRLDFVSSLTLSIVVNFLINGGILNYSGLTFNKELSQFIIHPAISFFYDIIIILVETIGIFTGSFLPELIEKDTEPEIISLRSYQNLTGAFSYIFFISFLGVLSSNILPSVMYPEYFLLFLLISLVLSYFNIFFSGSTGLNLAVIPLIIIAVILGIYYGFIPKTQYYEYAIIVFIASFIYFYAVNRIEVDRNGRITGSVVSSSRAFYFSLPFLLILWFILRTFFLKDLLIDSIFFLILPETSMDILADFLKGRKTGKVGSIGGLGMSDGLWLQFLISMFFILALISTLNIAI